jgi:hypothetical protein
MMGDRPVLRPTEAVIWGTTGALGVLTGVGAAFLLWGQLHLTAERGLLTAALAALTAGLALIGWAAPGVTARVFLIAAALSLLVAFFVGGSLFSTLGG